MTHLRVLTLPRVVALGVVFLASTATAQNSDTTARSTGLPKKVQWKFNFDAGVGAFGFGNSLYTDARPDPRGTWATTGWRPSRNRRSRPTTP